ncbi:MAG: peptide chain release factor N(5)-glutamine methyltransferase [Armatimonadota bacterium]|nr:peptide chain release factor N(5)-glutamine methyltransferase [Armatimonadota bacterium]MCX7776657.1 peptide chain release factor N(5)-glutamine methyltransferase [Armatimonadota bacterium]MDW8025728.1 peptide chain release factor N(5)-glutamine methyltransferase [Armatimonadota bacterium]
MVVNAALKMLISELLKAGVPTPQADAEWLLAHLLGCSRTEVHLHQNKLLSRGELQLLKDLLTQRLRRRPLAYILGYWDFMGLRIKLDERAMIPRPETEQLVERVIMRLRCVYPCKQDLLLADVGTGSGAIAIALAVHFPKAYIFATDISENALCLARENAILHGVDDRIIFLRGSLLEPLEAVLQSELNAIVANLPYISDDEVAELPPEVVNYEPKESWYGGVDGLFYIRGLVEQSLKWLCNGGLIALEVGVNQAEKVADMLGATCQYERIEMHLDLAGVKRFVMAQRK